MRSLRIVLVTLEAPVPFGNAASRGYYVLLRELVARGHRVTCFSACSKVAEIDEAKRLFPAPTYDVRLYPFPVRSGLLAKLRTLRRPYSYMFSADLRRDLDAELARGFDVLHLEQLLSGWLGLTHAAKSLVSVHYLARVDLADERPSDTKGRRDRWLRFRAERTLLRRFPKFRACSSRLASEILATNPSARVAVVPFGLDATLYPIDDPTVRDASRAPAPIVSVIGDMRWAPTFSAAERCLTRLWPEIKRRVPAVRLQLVGWGAKSALATYRGLEDVSIEEDVPDTRPHYQRTSVLLYAPRRGSGMKIKVLEALAYGVPVVTTGEGVEGLPAVDGVHAGVADDDAGLIERTVRLLGDVAAADRQRAAGRALIESHCGPKSTTDAIERIYEGVIGTPP